VGEADNGDKTDVFVGGFLAHIGHQRVSPEGIPLHQPCPCIENQPDLCCKENNKVKILLLTRNRTEI